MGDGSLLQGDMVWYVKNVLGDIQGLYSESRRSMDVMYTYDAWGVPTFHNAIPVTSGILGGFTH
ncbi:MAG: hypothetical protein LBJ12_00220, partial [Oscillospiraceae bacterium]|nr:hypothetical protein [Oscillospiraceae bacterium]